MNNQGECTVSFECINISVRSMMLADMLTGIWSEM